VADDYARTLTKGFEDVRGAVGTAMKWVKLLVCYETFLNHLAEETNQWLYVWNTNTSFQIS